MSLSGYGFYTRELLSLARQVTSSSGTQGGSDAHAALNGQASAQLRRLVPLSQRRDMGAFFTSGDVRHRFASLLEDNTKQAAHTKYWDPACGAGDLLLAAAAALPVRATLRETLSLWGSTLRGSDVEPDFVEAARLRLFIAAALRHSEAKAKADVDVDRGVRAFRSLRVEDGLAALRRTRGFRGHLLMNPPYGSVLADRDCDWAQGSTSQAAFFALDGVRALAVGSGFSAILPDVLRSGSRYEDWRSRMDATVITHEITPYGRFDPYTDVDVFLVSGIRRHRNSPSNGPTSRWWQEMAAEGRLGDYFAVNVGPVVDNRSPHSGPVVPFLTARDLPASGVTGAPSRRRQFEGRLTQPPFVALRRTSRPGQGRGGSTRAAGVMITGDSPIAVDNHVITAKPHSGAEMDCLGLLKVLDDPETNEWLDQRIRCRHLTVGVVRAFPWPPSAPRTALRT